MAPVTTTANPPPDDIVPVETCPWCDVDLTAIHRQAGRCGTCGFEIDDDTVWIFPHHVSGPRLRATLLLMRTVITLPALVVVWVTLGPVAGGTVAGIYVAITVFHIIREVVRGRTDGTVPILLGPTGVSRWADIARRTEEPHVIPWSAFQDVHAQELHDGSWRFMLRRGLWQPDLGGLVRAERAEIRRLVEIVRGRINSRTPTSASAPDALSKKRERNPS